MRKNLASILIILILIILGVIFYFLKGKSPLPIGEEQSDNISNQEVIDYQESSDDENLQLIQEQNSETTTQQEATSSTQE